MLTWRGQALVPIGCGRSSNPKMDNSIWPGFNCCIFLVLDDNKKMELIDNLKDILKKKQLDGLKVFEIPVLEVI